MSSNNENLLKQNAQKSQRKQRSSLRLLFLIVLVAALVPLAFKGWYDLYDGFLERNSPRITFEETPRGVGQAPVKVKITLSDDGTGLDEVIVRALQRGKSREVLKQTFRGEARANIEVAFPGINSKLEEGHFTLEVKAFDRSFWSNVGEKNLDLVVDYRKPKVEVLTTQHNARLGGSQMVFYRAYDEDIGISGVKVGNRTFEGFPARSIDPALDDNSLYVAIYAIDREMNIASSPVRVFAEDRVGNAVSVSFYNKVLDRKFVSVSATVREDFLRDRVAALADNNFPLLQNVAKESGKVLQYKSVTGTLARLLEQFRLVNIDLRKYNEWQVVSLLKNPRFERTWNGSFLKHPGSNAVGFGEKIIYLLSDQNIGEAFAKGYEIRSTPRTRVVAANDGVVIFSDNLGVYGRTVAIDHGLGLVSIYSRLAQAQVSEGDRLKRGEEIGQTGETGLALAPQLYFELRVQGVPVDPREWWDETWINTHISAKIDEVKNKLGLNRYVPIE